MPIAQISNGEDAINVRTKLNSVITIVNGIGSLAPVATTGMYSDLIGKPTLGSAATRAATDFATAAQGAKADTSVQPAQNATVLGSSGAAAGQVLAANGAGGTGWIAIPSGVTNFLGLNDTPSAFTANYTVQVNSAGTALEFVAPKTYTLAFHQTDGTVNQLPLTAS